MYEPEVFAAWSQALLTGDATLMALLPGGVWDTVAPPTTPPPFVVRSFAGGPGPVYSEGVRLVWFDGLWYFTPFVAGNDRATLYTILSRMVALLHRQSGSAAGGTVVLCVQEGAPIASPTDATGGALMSAMALPFSAQVQIP
jgi:hypothetical protein